MLVHVSAGVSLADRCRFMKRVGYVAAYLDLVFTRRYDRTVFGHIDVFKDYKSFGCVKLKNNYRSEIGELADLL